MTNPDHVTEQPSVEAPEEPSSFEEFKLSQPLAKAIAAMGFEKPTPVQVHTYERVLAGEDLIIQAQTGTGKTAAFGMPFAMKLDPKGGIQALVLAPTRELALQVSREVDAICKGSGVVSVAVYGGASFTKQVEEVGAGAQIVVGTPGRVLDHMRRRTIGFEKLKILVLDEADEMLSMGFEKELSEIMSGLPTQRQTLLFSATIPEDIQRLAGRYMEGASIISVSGDEIAAAAISHFVYLVSGSDRLRMLVRVIKQENPDSALIFCNTKDETQAVARYLKDAGYNADWINSDLSQAERERVMAATRSAKLRFLVATDVAARGIDISQLSHVINYTFPESLEVYIHRTGRTGRQGRAGAAISLIAPQDIGNLYFLRLTYKIFPIEKTLPERDAEDRALELARLARLRAEIDGAAVTGFRTLARRLLTAVDAERIITGLLTRYFGDEPPPAAVEPPRRDTTPAPPPAVERRSPPEETESIPPEPEGAEGEDGFGHAVEGGREIFIDAGRKDGLRISGLMKDIVAVSGLPRTAIGRVRMLTRATFIAVPDDSYDKVFEALGKLEIDGRRLRVEPAVEK
ncbi:MAG: DEAD/DEAH box helicase [Proteobacteria bacterium]|jgi:ATP-dependent RNA helicase DeaD|nr:DEAD/DEAH box helicase [Pseudomonadota bacterium]